MWLKEVESSPPVIADTEHVDTVFLNIADFLIPAAFRNDDIHIPNCCQDSAPIFVSVQASFSFALIKFVGRKCDRKMIPKFAGPLQQVNVAVVQQIKSAVSDNLGHWSREKMRSDASDWQIKSAVSDNLGHWSREKMRSDASDCFEEFLRRHRVAKDGLKGKEQGVLVPLRMEP
jgi:hypothetical protein